MYLLIVLAFVSLSMAQRHHHYDHRNLTNSSPVNSLSIPSPYDLLTNYLWPSNNNYTTGNGTSGNYTTGNEASGNYTTGNETSGNATGVHNQTDTPFRHLMVHVNVQSWCDQFVRPGTTPTAIPENANSTFLATYMAEFIIPEQQSTWYDWCYIPYRGVLTANSWYNGGIAEANRVGLLQTANNWYTGGIAAANRAFDGAMRTAASGIATFQDVLAQTHSDFHPDS